MKRIDQIETLSRIVEQISGELDLDELLARIVHEACGLIGADDGAIGLRDPAREVIRIAVVHNLPARELGAEARSGQGLAGAVLKYGGPVICRCGDLPDILV